MKYSTRLLSITLYLLLILPFQSFALGESYSFGIGVGQSSFQLKQASIIANYSGLTSSSSFTDSSTTLLFSGGVQLDPYLSLNLEYLAQGDIKATESLVQKKLFDVSTLTFAVGLHHEFNERFNGYARLGVHMWDATTGSDFDSVDGTVDLTYGIGMDINIYGGRERLMRIQWDRYDYDGVYLDSSDVISISLMFIFGD